MSTEINQCDGCQRGIPIVGGVHKAEGEHFHHWQVCTANRYNISERLSQAAQEHLIKRYGDNKVFAERGGTSYTGITMANEIKNKTKRGVEVLEDLLGLTLDLLSRGRLSLTESDDLEKYVEHRLSLYPDSDDLPLSQRGGYDAYLNVLNEIKRIKSKRNGKEEKSST